VRVRVRVCVCVCECVCVREGERERAHTLERRGQGYLRAMQMGGEDRLVCVCV